MIRAVGMFGSDAAAIKLHNTLKNRRVHLERHNFKHPDDMLARLADAPEIAAILLVEKALKEHNPDIMATLEYLRAADSTVRIIFIKDEPERDYNFELWCYGRGIYDFAYPSRHTDVNIDAIRDAVLLGRIDQNNPPPPPVECPDTQAPRTVRERVRKTPSLCPQTPLLAAHWSEWKIPSLSEFLRKPRQEPKSDTVEPQAPVPRIIGIINCSRGFGATTLVVNMAKCLLDAGRGVAAVAMDFSPDLGYSSLKDTDVAVVIPYGGELPDWDALLHEYEFIIVDFGAIFEFLPSGNAIPAQSGVGMAIAVRDAMHLCDLRIYLASSEPWHTRKAKAFEADDKGFVTFGQETDASVILHTIGVI